MPMQSSVGHPEKPLDDYLGVFRQRCHVLNQRALIFFIGMFLAYYGITQNYRDVLNYDEAWTKSFRADQDKGGIISEIAKRVNSGKLAGQRISVDDNNIYDFATPTQRDKLERISEIINDFGETRTNGKERCFVPGFGFIGAISDAFRTHALVDGLFVRGIIYSIYERCEPSSAS